MNIENVKKEKLSVIFILVFDKIMKSLIEFGCPVLNKLTLLKSKSVSVCETIVE